MIPDKPWACVSRCGGIGDNLMAAAVLPELAKRYTIDMLTNDHLASAVYENNPHITKLTKVHDEDIPKDSMQSWQGWFAKRAREFPEFFINLSHSCESLVAIPQTQTPFYWPDAWRRKHCGANYLETIAEICGIDPVFTEPLFYPTEAEREKARITKQKVGKRCIGFCAAGSRLDKYHPLTPIIIARLIKELDMPVILFGASEREADVARMTEDHVAKANGSLAGLHEAITCYEVDGKTVRHDKAGLPIEWSVRRAITQLMACDLIIGPDTGLVWGAAFEDVPKIVLLSHASPENIIKHWRNALAPQIDTEQAPCWPCHRLHDDITHCRRHKSLDGAACISSIKADTVVSVARVLLGDTPVFAPPEAPRNGTPEDRKSVV